MNFPRLRARWWREQYEPTWLAPVNGLSALLDAVLPENRDFCLDNIVLARKRAAS